MTRLASLVAAVAMLCACGDDDVITTQPPPTSGHGAGGDGSACAPGEAAIEDGTCRPAGVPPDTPPPGPTKEPDAGVPPDACAEGFVADGDAGCAPVLPSTPCTDGMFAIPGETDCHPVSPCGMGTWGAVPVDATTQYVDAAYVGPSSGSPSEPWTTVQAAVDAAAPGGLVAIAAGTYGPVVVEGKAVRLWGRCPDLVEIASPDPSNAALTVADAPGSEVHALAVTGGNMGIELARSSGMLVEALWVHDTANVGLVAHEIDPPGVVLKSSLFERGGDVGIVVAGADAVIDGCAVRDTSPGAQALGHGIDLGQLDGVSATAVVRRSVLERNVEGELIVLGSTVQVEATVMRGTTPNSVTQLNGVGLYLDQGSEAKVSGCLIDDERTTGVAVRNSHAVVDATVIRGTKPSLVQGHSSSGLGIYGFGAFPAAAELSRSLIEQSQGLGIHAQNGTLSADGVLVRGTTVTTEDVGAALWLETFPGLPRASGSVRGSVLADNHSGVVAFAADLTLEESVVRDTDGPHDDFVRHGIELHDRTDYPETSKATLRAVRIDRAQGAAVALLGSEVTLESVEILDTRPDELGHGLGVMALKHLETGRRASAAIRGSAVRASRTYGLLAIGSDLDVESTVVAGTEANSIDSQFGGGIELDLADDGDGSAAAVRWSTIDENRDRGIFVWASSLTAVGVLVSATRSTLADDSSGGGIWAVADPLSGRRATLDVSGSVIEGVRTAGMAIRGTDATVQSTLIQGMLAQASDSKFGWCIGAAQSSTLDVLDSRLDGCIEIGVSSADGTGSVARTTVANVSARATDDALGDGVLVMGGGPFDVDGVRIEQAARVGITAFGTEVRVRDAVLECNAIDLDQEAQGTFANLGGNVCGCGGDTRACVAKSASLSPPEPLPDSTP